MSTSRSLLATRVYRELVAAIGKDRVSTTATELEAHSRDMWPRALLQSRIQGKPPFSPHVVTWPKSAEEVSAIVQLARREKMAIVPWGAGSGLSGAACPNRGGIIIDCKLMQGIRIDQDNALAHVGAGTLGGRLEERANLSGFTLGHYPDSLNYSTVGGWLATRAVGRASGHYGGIEKRVQSFDVVLGTGETLHCDRENASDLMGALVGSEGTLGITTQVSLRLSPLPELRTMRGYAFSRIEHGCEAMRKLVQAGLHPSILRLYDAVDTFAGRHARRSSRLSMFSELSDLTPRADATTLKLPKRILRGLLGQAKLLGRATEALADRAGGGCLLLIGFEGMDVTTRTSAQLAHDILLAAGARDLGSEPATAWLASRHSVAHKQTALWEQGAFVDSIDVSAGWGQVVPLYNALREALSAKAFAIGRLSHAYATGCALHFSFGAAIDPPEKAMRVYDELWRNALTEVVRAGAGLSHHHGVGLARAPFWADALGSSLAVVRALKQSCDPDGILNPGKLLP